MVGIYLSYIERCEMSFAPKNHMDFYDPNFHMRVR